MVGIETINMVDFAVPEKLNWVTPLHFNLKLGTVAGMMVNTSVG